MLLAMRIALVYCAAALISTAAFGQAPTVDIPRPTPTAATAPVSCSATVGPIFPRTSSGPADTVPYSAVQETTEVQILADGTHISPKARSVKIYFDAQGRLRQERALCPEVYEVRDAALVLLRDPVAGYGYYLDQQKRVAYRYSLNAPNREGANPAVRPRPATQETLESIGTQTIEGILVEGTRITTVIPAGAENNDRPLTVVTESWRSPELRATVLSKHIDPRYGEQTTRLLNIDRSVPDPALFQPSPDYTIQDTSDRVTIKYTRP
jgi:hypothetical protein